MSKTGRPKSRAHVGRGRIPNRSSFDAPAFELLEPRLLLSVGGLGEQAIGGGPLPGDANYDGKVDVLDLAALANNFG